MLGGPFSQGWVPFPRGHGFEVEVVQVTSGPEAVLDQETFVVSLHRDQLGAIGLQLDRKQIK